MHRLALIALAVVALTCVALAGCGSEKAATSPAPQPIATAVAGDTSPKPGLTRPKSKSTAVSQMATGSRDHAGQFCSGRSDARYAGEGLICITGRLEKK